MSEVDLELAEAQAHDSENIDKRLTSLESKMDMVLENNNAITSKLNEAVGKAHKFDLIVSIVTSKTFMFFAFVIMVAIAIGGSDFLSAISRSPVVYQEAHTGIAK